MFNYQDGGYARSMFRTWQYFFFPPSYDFSTGNGKIIFTINQTLENIERDVTQYFTLNSNSITHFKYVDTTGSLESGRDCLVVPIAILELIDIKEFLQQI